MARTRLLRGTAILLSVWLAGCSADQQLSMKAAFQADSTRDQFEVGGSLEDVLTELSVKMTPLLKTMTVTKTRQADTIRLACESKVSTRFTLVLTQIQTKQGQRVRGQIQWENGRDEELSNQLMMLAANFIVQD